MGFLFWLHYVGFNLRNESLYLNLNFFLKKKKERPTKKWKLHYIAFVYLTGNKEVKEKLLKKY